MPPLAGRRLATLLVRGGGAALHVLLWQLERAPQPRRLWGDEIMYADLAERAARGQPAEVELLWPPLYPRLLGLAARFGPLAAGRGADARAARGAVAVAQIALLLCAVVALRALALRLSGSACVADLAAALALLDPHLAAFAHYLWPEALHLALFLGALALLVRRSGSLFAVAAAGLLLGLALLTKSLLQPFLPLLLAPLVVAHGWRRGCGRATLALAAVATVVAPTVVSNGRRAGAWVVADSARFNLWVGLNDRAPRNFVDEIVGDEYNAWRASAATFVGRQALLRRRIDAFVAERGPGRVLRDQLARQYFRLLGTDSFLTDQLPGGAIARLGYGYVDPPSAAARLLRAWSHAHYALVLAAAGFGLVLASRLHAAPAANLAAEAARRTSRSWLAVMAAFLAYNLVIFLFLHVKTRYRVPLLPFLELAAALAFARLPALLARRDPAMTGGRTWTLGALVSALLLGLAFLEP